MTYGPRSVPAPERFWPKVQRSEGCWTWTGAKDWDGYPIFGLSSSQKSVRGHRWVYEQENGPIPPGMQVCHTCDNPSCVRPDHLFLGTNQDNMTDRNRKGRTSKGEAHYAAKLTDEQVSQIRSLRDSGLRHREIAERFGVSRPYVSDLLRGRKRKD